jgi:hypothetical protein
LVKGVCEMRMRENARRVMGIDEQMKEREIGG